MKASNRVTKNPINSRYTNIKMSEKEINDQEEEYSRKTEAAKKVSLCKGDNLRNLILMCICWFAISFNTTLLHFQLKYIPGDIFVNSTIYAVAEVFGHVVCTFTFNRVNPRYLFCSGFICAAAGGLCLAFIDHEGT